MILISKKGWNHKENLCQSCPLGKGGGIGLLHIQSSFTFGCEERVGFGGNTALAN